MQLLQFRLIYQGVTDRLGIIVSAPSDFDESVLFVKMFCRFVVTADFKKYVSDPVFTAFIKKIVHKAVRRSLLSVSRQDGYAVKFAFVRYALTAYISYRSVIVFITDKRTDRTFGEYLRFDTAACPRYGKAFFFDHPDITA